MARPKSFHQDKALEQAMHLFWEKGFEATSIQDLVDRLGINRQSIYDTFGDKKQLFLRCLELYRNQSAKDKLSNQIEGQTVQEIFDMIFKFMIDASINDSRGCFIANTTLELASRDEAVAKLVCDNLEANEADFKQLLLAAQEKGEIASDKDVEALARYLFNSIQGMRVTAKASTDPKRLEDIAKITLSVLH